MNDIAILQELNTQLARNNLIDFTEVTNPAYDAKWYHELLCSKLDTMLTGGIKRLMVFMPPQHGKSELVSRRLPAYALGRNPALKIAACSYSSDLASKFNREVQRIIDNPSYAKIFPETVLSGSPVSDRGRAKGSWMRNSDVFEIVGKGGSYKSVGVMGPLTGDTVDGGILDDLIKDRLEAESPTHRKRIWEWYLDVFSPRLHNDSWQLLTATRWHEDDLAGRLLCAERDKWEVLCIPAIKEEDNPLDPRKIGECLWPERHSLEAILEKKAKSERTFSSLYQQRPAPLEGSLLKIPWFKYYSVLPSDLDKVIHSWDCTFDDGGGSFVVGQVWGMKGSNSYLITMVRGDWNFPETVKQVKGLYQAHPCQEILIEKKANGAAVISTLEGVIPGIIPVNPTESKEARAAAVSYAIEAGNVYLPEQAVWIQEALEEIRAFPNAKNDDIVDAMTQALNHLYNGYVLQIF